MCKCDRYRHQNHNRTIVCILHNLCTWDWLFAIGWESRRQPMNNDWERNIRSSIELPYLSLAVEWNHFGQASRQCLPINDPSQLLENENWTININEQIGDISDCALEVCPYLEQASHFPVQASPNTGSAAPSRWIRFRQQSLLDQCRLRIAAYCVW